MKNFANQSKSNKSKAMFLIALAWLVYTTSYLGKVNYNANVTQIMDFYGVTKAQAGEVPSFFFFAYGIGQVVNGLLCKKYNIKWTIFFSLIVSAAINLTIALTSEFSIIKWLWMINGFVLSILWPTIVRLLAEALPQKVLSASSVIMGTTVAAGTLVIYGLSSLFAAFGKFKYSFYSAAFAVIAVAVIWLLFYNKATVAAKEEKSNDVLQTESKEDKVSQTQQGKAERKIFFASIYILCFFAIGVNLIKDGLTTWVPSILKEEFGLSDALSILLTLSLPVLAIFGNAFALKVHNKIPDYITHCVTFFAVMALCIGGIIGSLALKLVVFMLAGLLAVNFLASSLNSLITSIFPLFMRGKVNSGLFAGILNGFCYVGSTISSYGLGAIADNFGWTSVFWTLIGFCVLTFGAGGIYACIKRIKN